MVLNKRHIHFMGSLQGEPASGPEAAEKLEGAAPTSEPTAAEERAAPAPPPVSGSGSGAAAIKQPQLGLKRKPGLVRAAGWFNKQWVDG